MSDMAVQIARIEERQGATDRRVENHETVCAARYGEISDSFVRVHSRLDSLVKGVGLLVITTLLGMVGFLISKLPIWG